MIKSKRRFRPTCNHEKVLVGHLSSIPTFTLEKHCKQAWPTPTFKTYYAGKGKYIKNKFYTSFCEKCGYKKVMIK